MPSARQAGWLGLLWAFLVVLSVVIHRAAWLSPEPSQAVMSFASLLHVVEAPGWFVLRVVSGGWGRGHLLTPLIVASITWAVWITAVWLFLPVRKAAVKVGRGGVALGAGPDLSRRRFLVDIPLAAGALAPGVTIARSTMISPWDLQLRRYRIPITGLPAAFEGLRLVQLSDTHLGPRVPLSFLRRAVSDAMDLRPDVFLLTGDYIMSGQRRIAAATEVFAPLVATRKPVVGVLGNHDWYGDGPAVAAAMRGVGVRMIDNARTFLADDRSLVDAPLQDSLCLAGIGDLVTDTVDFASALAGVPDENPRLLLSHNPDAAEHADCTHPGAPRIDLMISGHTHGGQILLPLIGAPFIPSRYGDKYLGGLVRGPACPVLISRGVGMSILPIRLGVPPELVEITLTRA